MRLSEAAGKTNDEQERILGREGHKARGAALHSIALRCWKKFRIPVSYPSSHAHARSALAMRMQALLLGLELRDLLRLLSVEYL